MAKRKRKSRGLSGLSGSPAEHEKGFARDFARAQKHLGEASRSIEADRCQIASDHLFDAERMRFAAMVENEYLNFDHSRELLKLSADADALESKFKKVCVRKS